MTNQLADVRGNAPCLCNSFGHNLNLFSGVQVCRKIRNARYDIMYCDHGPSRQRTSSLFSMPLVAVNRRNLGGDRTSFTISPGPLYGPCCESAFNKHNPAERIIPLCSRLISTRCSLFKYCDTPDMFFSWPRSDPKYASPSFVKPLGGVRTVKSKITSEHYLTRSQVFLPPPRK